ncbi:hypothetical protein GOBAR_DD16018 [Gossypium barbadense]|nr:hypothetical protein GOBAR_DD16018 [Gossypium barbadense]
MSQSPLTSLTSIDEIKFQYSGARCGAFFLRFIKFPETSDTGGHVGRHAVKLVLFFLTISDVAAVQASARHHTSSYPPDPEDVLVEQDGSRTESGVTKPSSRPESDNLSAMKKMVAESVEKMYYWE